MHPNKILTSHDWVRLAAAAVVSPKTVERIYGGSKSASTTRERVRLAAVELGLPPPPTAPQREPHEAA